MITVMHSCGHRGEWSIDNPVHIAAKAARPCWRCVRKELADLNYGAPLRVDDMPGIVALNPETDDTTAACLITSMGGTVLAEQVLEQAHPVTWSEVEYRFGDSVRYAYERGALTAPDGYTWHILIADRRLTLAVAKAAMDTLKDRMSERDEAIARDYWASVGTNP